MTVNIGFKRMSPVPSVNDFLDIVLSKTQRKTPTVIHKGYAITRIRSFYMRKVRFTQNTFDEKLGGILTEFPRLEDIHPFYADLANVLYDRDHYKLALGQINTARSLIDRVGKDYSRLLKYGDSLYRCKQLKRAALGRMATIMKRQKDTLAYLEQVRQHMSRLPAIDPNTRTLLIAGFPNVGKSSFMNKLSNAHVDVQPYAFTTKSLFVGHFDYKLLRWQVIDTPGILDHPLEERNTIEMQSITALAHLRAAILFFIDISETCGYSIAQQVSLFNSIRPLFSNKPVQLVLNKIDLIRPEHIDESDKALLQSLLDSGVEIASSSCVTEEGIMAVRNSTCEKLLALRVDTKLQGTGAKRIEDVLNRLHLTVPQSRDQKSRPPCIPDAIKARQAAVSKDQQAVGKMSAKEVERNNGGAGVYLVDLKKEYLLERSEWRYDVIPEIMDGHNIADFIDPEIEERLARLEAEEEHMDESGEYLSGKVDYTLEDQDNLQKLKEHNDKNTIVLNDHRAGKRHNRRPVLTARLTKRKSSRSDSTMDNDDDKFDGSGSENDADMSLKRPRLLTRDRSTLGLKDAMAVERVDKLQRAHQKKSNLFAKRGESDRAIRERKPRHLFSGKRKQGTHDRR